MRIANHFPKWVIIVTHPCRELLSLLLCFKDEDPGLVFPQGSPLGSRAGHRTGFSRLTLFSRKLFSFPLCALAGSVPLDKKVLKVTPYSPHFYGINEVLGFAVPNVFLGLLLACSILLIPRIRTRLRLGTLASLPRE